MKKLNCKLKTRALTLVLIFVIVLSGCSNETEVVKPTDGDYVNELHRARIEENLEEWFGGKKLHKYVGNNRDYEWYLDQYKTGKHKAVNCGPTAAVMAMKWANEDFEGTPEEARQLFKPKGGGWSKYDMAYYFQHQEQEYSYIFFYTDDRKERIEKLKEQIDLGNIVILSVNMDYIEVEYNMKRRINKYYKSDGGHYLIAKGYVEVDDKTYFEVYDPNNWGRIYDDGTPRGKDRYYDADMLIEAIYNWWTIGYVIGEDSNEANTEGN